MLVFVYVGDVNIMPLDSYLGRSESREQGSLDLPQKIDRYQKKEQNTAVEVLAAVNGWKHLLFRILLHFYSASQSGGPRWRTLDQWLTMIALGSHRKVI